MRWDSWEREREREREREMWFVLLFGFEISLSMICIVDFELGWSMISMWWGGGGARFKPKCKIILRVN